MKFLIAGFGSIGRRHFRNLKALGQEDIVLLRSNRSTLETDEIEGVLVETTIEDALKHKPDGVIIANPTALHLDVAIPAAKAEAHILMEKPVSDSAARIPALQAALDASGAQLLVGFQFRFHPGVSYRHLMVLKGELPGITTVPPHDYIEQDVTAHFNRYLAVPAWKTVLDKAGALLADHPVNKRRREAGKNPANMIWLWGEGKMPSAPNLARRFNITGSMISAVDLLKGLGVVGGLDVINVPGATGYIDTNYEGKAQAAIDSLKHQDFVFVHLEAPDEAGHQGSLADKVTAIEDFDSRIVAPIVGHLRQSGEQFRVVVTMDHFTPLSVRTHTRDLVPTLLYDSRTTKGGSGRDFNEREALAHDQAMGNSLGEGHMMIEKLLERT